MEPSLFSEGYFSSLRPTASPSFFFNGALALQRGISGIYSDGTHVGLQASMEPSLFSEGYLRSLVEMVVAKSASMEPSLFSEGYGALRDGRGTVANASMEPSLFSEGYMS